jgi:hypothetical protein
MGLIYDLERETVTRRVQAERLLKLFRQAGGVLAERDDDDRLVVMAEDDVQTVVEQFARGEGMR